MLRDTLNHGEILSLLIIKELPLGIKTGIHMAVTIINNTIYREGNADLKKDNHIVKNYFKSKPISCLKVFPSNWI